MAFPVTKRYFLDFRNSDTGLTPTFVFLQVTPGFGATSPASPAGGIIEKSNGRYYFDWIWLTTADSDIVFEVDGGVSIPTEEVRYIKGTISPRDAFLDEPISQIKDDVWNDVVNRTVGTKGDFVEHIGIDTDAVDAATVFGKIYAVQGAGFVGGTDSLKIISDNVDAINIETDAASIANAVWDASTTGNITGGTMGGLSDAIKTAVDAINIETDAASIADAVWDATTAGNITGGTMGGLVNTAASGTAPSAATVAAAVWDEAIAGHTTASTFGQTLQLEDSGSVQAGGLSTEVRLRAGASAITDFYKNGLIAITSGTGIGQSRSITAYDGTTKLATVDRAWGTQPVATDGYMISPAAPSSGGAAPSAATVAAAVWNEATSTHTAFGSFGQTLQLQDSGQCKGGGVSTITLRVGASGALDFYKNSLIAITSGTGVGQARKITGYTLTTRVATVDRGWDIIPITDDSTYMILPMVPSSSGGGGGGVQFFANGDTVNPIIVQVASPKHTQIKVTYSEPVEMNTGANGALNLANYSVVGLTLLAVTQLTAQQVMLTTSAQTANFLYSIVVTNVKDLSGNPIL